MSSHRTLPWERAHLLAKRGGQRGKLSWLLLQHRRWWSAWRSAIEYMSDSRSSVWGWQELWVIEQTTVVASDCYTMNKRTGQLSCAAGETCVTTCSEGTGGGRVLRRLWSLGLGMYFLVLRMWRRRLLSIAGNTVLAAVAVHPHQKFINPVKVFLCCSVLILTAAVTQHNRGIILEHVKTYTIFNILFFFGWCLNRTQSIHLYANALALSGDFTRYSQHTQIFFWRGCHKHRESKTCRVSRGTRKISVAQCCYGESWVISSSKCSLVHS